jgi:translocator assembly and maintenance protein 41
VKWKGRRNKRCIYPADSASSLQVLPLLTSPSLHPHLSANNLSALRISLLLLSPLPDFTEQALYEQIAGLSYSGDPRMSVPGAENPEKVRNIVRGQGVLDGMRGVYGRWLKEEGVRWDGDDVSEKSSTGYGSEEWEWKGRGEGILTVCLLHHFASTNLG